MSLSYPELTYRSVDTPFVYCDWNAGGSTFIGLLMVWSASLVILTVDITMRIWRRQHWLWKLWLVVNAVALAACVFSLVREHQLSLYWEAMEPYCPLEN